MEELNKKLAEWVGLRFEMSSGGWKMWFDKQGNPVSPTEDNMPMFTTSLDACITYILPKLESYMIKQNIWGTEHHCWIMFGGKSATSSEETAALAFCRAVEKLIDGKE